MVVVREGCKAERVEVVFWMEEDLEDWDEDAWWMDRAPRVPCI